MFNLYGEARLRAFFQFWTAKEAVLKAISLGLQLELSKLEIGLRPLRILAFEDPATIQWRELRTRGFSARRGLQRYRLHPPAACAGELPAIRSSFLRRSPWLSFFADISRFSVWIERFCFPVMISLTVLIYNEEGSVEELFEKVRKVMNRHGAPDEDHVRDNGESLG